MLGSLIGAGATIAGGLMADKRNEKNAAQQAALQREFAQKGIQWRVEDAARAGVSKLYALGANTTSYAPVSVGGSNMGNSMASAGQNIGRALDATASPLGRAGTLATEIASAQLEGVKIDNDIKKQELQSRQNLRAQPGTPPAILNSETTPLVEGQGNAKIKLQRDLVPAGNNPNRSFGVNPEVDFYRTKYGYAPEVPQELGEAQESQPLSAAQWFMRNKMMPHLSDAFKTYPHPASGGDFWTFDPLFGEYILVNKGGSKHGPTRQHRWEYMMDKLRR